MTTHSHCVVSGAGSGLGLGLAIRLLRRGHRLSLIDLGFDDNARQQLADASSTEDQWQAYPLDIRDTQALKQAVSNGASAFGPVALAINCAGIILNRRFTDTTPEDFARVVDINLNGSMYFAKAVLPHMQAGSRLGLIASMAGLVSNYAYAAYGASKFGVVGLATPLRYEYEPLGIGISCICPPEVRTPMVVAERQDGDPVSLQLKDIAGSMEAPQAIDSIIQELDAGCWMIIPGIRSRLTAGFARHCPALFHFFMQRIIRHLLQRHPTQETRP